MAGAIGPLVQQVVGLVDGIQASKLVKYMAVLVMPWTSCVVVPMFDRSRPSLNSVIGSFRAHAYHHCQQKSIMH